MNQDIQFLTKSLSKLKIKKTMPPSKSIKYGITSLTNNCIYSWNTLTENLDKASTHPIINVEKIICITSLLTTDLISEQCYLFTLFRINGAIKCTDLCFLSPPLLLAFFFSRIIDFHNNHAQLQHK